MHVCWLFYLSLPSYHNYMQLVIMQMNCHVLMVHWFYCFFMMQSSYSDSDDSGPEIWNESTDEEDNARVTVSDQTPTTPGTTVYVKVITLFVLVWQGQFRIANHAVSVLLKFFSFLLLFLGKLTKSNDLRAVAEKFPDNVIKAQTKVGLNRNDFKEFVCCPQCCAIYSYEECLLANLEPKTCSSCLYPLHPKPSSRKTCGSDLLKLVKTTRKKVYKPIKVYCYKSVITSLQNLLCRPGIIDECQHWRKRDVPIPGVYADVYDGAVWKKFEQSGYFSQMHSYAFLLNVDWFEPYEYSVYATGVVFLCLLNLPRHIRYCQENILICGLIPGPKEPSHTVNPFLEPLVEDFLHLWPGVEMELRGGIISKVRAALICVSCDSPAVRKVAGFLSHSATKGCYKCLKTFPTNAFGDKPDFSGFNREEWPLRTHSNSYAAGMEHRHAKTAKARNTIEKAHGIRYTVLSRLPYYDIVRFTVIDPMHNLLLGSAKTFVKFWRKDINLKSLEELQIVVDKFTIPAGVGRIPRKVESGFSNFKAEQWKNWMFIYSLVCFKPLLTDMQYLIWVTFVQACSLFCSRAITHNNIIVADQLIHRYCCFFEELFGKENCYPNLHLHCHLKDCLLDYGPASAFWLFGFERLNGILGNVHTSNRAVEIQLLRKFISKQQIHSIIWPGSELSDLIKPLLSPPTKTEIDCGGIYVHVLNPFDIKSINIVNKSTKLLPPIKEKGFLVPEIDSLSQYFTIHFGNAFCKVLILHYEAKSAIFNGEIFGSYFSRQRNSSLIMVSTKADQSDTIYIPNFITGFLKCHILFRDGQETKDYILVKVIPLQPHSKKNYYPKPVEVWQMPNDDYLKDDSNAQYVFMSTILCRCAFTPFSGQQSLIPALTVIPFNHFCGLNNYNE